MKKQLILKPGDIALMSFVLASAIFLFILPFLSSGAAFAEIITAEDNEIRTVSLTESSEFKITSRNITLTVKIKDGKISVADSDCRDGICRMTPPISRSGQSIICAPAGVVVRITGEEADIDGISG